jgi:ribosome-binding factor A
LLRQYGITAGICYQEEHMSVGGGHRSERIAEEMLHEITLMLAGDLKDPRLAVPLTVNEVRLSPDMRHARVYVRIFSEPEERKSALKGLEAAAGYVRHELIERLQLRKAPEVTFVLDESEEYGEHIDDLIRKSKEAPGR